MKKFVLVIAAVSAAVFSALPSSADTLKFTGSSGSTVAGEQVYPYNFNIDGSSATTQLMCLDYKRMISTGEMWNVTISTVPVDSSSTSTQYRETAYIYSELGAYSAADVQYAAWDIFDDADVSKSAGFDANAQALVAASKIAATNASLIASGFFSGFELYLPTTDEAGWTNGIPQEFIGIAQTPEPSSLLLFGSGLIALAGTIRRKLSRS